MAKNNQNENIDDLRLVREWTRDCIELMAGAPEGKADVHEVLLGCGSKCFERMGLPEKLGAMKSLDEYLDFLTEEWKWKLSFDRLTGELTCDENKTECLCAVVNSCQCQIAPLLCSCTEGNLKRNFETAFKREVKTKLVTSLLRGGKSCIYRITIPNLTEEEMQKLEEASKR